MRKTLQTFAIGLLVGLSGLLVYALPIGFAWEEDTGLGMLFKLRGQRPAPSEVVVIAISDNTGSQLGLKNEVPAWPRSIHANLIDILTSAGAAVIVMDISFRNEQAPVQDEQFAASIQRAGNVILFGYLDQEMVKLDNSKPFAISSNSLHIERFRRPVDVLADSAAITAPFVLPKIPVKVSSFWTFYGANELATLPAVALENYVAQSLPDLISLLTALKPSLKEHFAVVSSQSSSGTQIDSIRTLLRSDQHLAKELIELLALTPRTISSASYHRLKALLSMYILPNYPYLNFYGPPYSVTTIPFRDVLSNDQETLEAIKDKVIFVGYAEQYQPKQKDGFYTVFSQPSGLDISGVEIAATAFANLLHTETITPLEPVGLIVVILVCGIIFTLLFRSFSSYWNILAGLFASLLYFLCVYQLFIRQDIWLPWIIPLFVITPLALFVGITLNFREARHERLRLQQIFGYYLPERIVDRLTHDTSEALERGESAFGVCLATDAEQYTRLAENMAPADLQILLNRYYEILFTPVRARGGMISDVVGDAMLAIWSASSANMDQRRKACEAALEIKQALNDSEQPSSMPTRIGMHAGQFVLSHIGAIDHYEYRAVGDIVNTASRIENLNKQLGTSIIASEETVQGIDGFITRELGVFQLKGKRQPVRLHELVCKTSALTDGIKDLLERFAEAISAYQKESWQEAYEKFQEILKNYPTDGPSQFYLELYRGRRLGDQIPIQTPPQSERGAYF